MEHVAHFEVRAGQPLVFDNVVVGPPQSPAFHIMFDLLTTAGEVMTAEDLFLVTVTAALAEPVDGDYNNNGTVDAADYVLWRKGGPLANEVDNPGTVNAQDYTEWRARFGNSGSGAGSGTTGSASSRAAVPEPNATTFCVFCALLLARRRPR
jgi:hypothetical protein